MSCRVSSEMTPSVPTLTRLASNRSGSEPSAQQTAVRRCTIVMPTIAEARLDSVAPVPWVPVVRAPAKRLGVDVTLIDHRQTMLAEHPDQFVDGRAGAHGGLPCIGVDVQHAGHLGQRQVQSVGQRHGEGRPELTRTFRLREVASATRPHSSSCEDGAALSWRTHDWLPTQFRQWLRPT